MPRLAGKDNLLPANSLRAGINSIFDFLGPGLAGVVMVHISLRLAFVIDAVSFIFPAIAMLFVKVLPEEAWRTEPNETVEDNCHVSEYGLLSLMRQDSQFTLTVIAHVVFCLGMWGINAVFYPYVRVYLDKGPEVMGWMISVYYGAGPLSGAVAGHWGRHIINRNLHMVMYVLSGFIWMLYITRPTVVSVTIISFLDGIVFTLVCILFDTILQERAPSRRLGTISGQFSVLMESGNMIGMLCAGAIGTWVSIPWAYAVCAITAMTIPILALTPATKYIVREG
jgi:MFS family permease